MVDALRRARSMLRLGGFVLDVHPTIEAPHLEVGSGVHAGDLHSEDARRRHAAADAAVATVLDLAIFTVEGTEDFSFRRYADSLSELQEYVAQKWTDAHLDHATVHRTVEILRAERIATLWLREQARVRKLQPIIHYSRNPNAKSE